MKAVHRASRQQGAAAVEFALIASLLFMLLFGLIEMGRLLWSWNAAVEATRYGARLAVVCDLTSSSQSLIKTKMITRLAVLASSNIVITYSPTTGGVACTASTCTSVNVALTGYTYKTMIPFVPLSLTLPGFGTTLRKEAMNSTNNQVCQ